MSYGRSSLQEKKGKEDLGSLKVLVQLQSTCQEVPLCPVRTGGQTRALPWGLKNQTNPILQPGEPKTHIGPDVRVPGRG